MLKLSCDMEEHSRNIFVDSNGAVGYAGKKYKTLNTQYKFQMSDTLHGKIEKRLNDLIFIHTFSYIF